MGSAKYKRDVAGFGAFMNGPEMAAVAKKAAEQAAEWARQNAPVGKTGDYVTSFEVNQITVTYRNHPRVAAELVNTSGHAAAVEYGNRGRAGHRILARAGEHLRGTT